MNILISGCLLGINCRYDGGSTEHKEVLELSKKHNLIPVCPEQLGGLPTPRVPAEIVGDKVLNKNGEDVTAHFQKGAIETLKLAKLMNCNYAILKERSPSCGCGQIYDGTFTGNLVEGNGITANLLVENGVKVIGEFDLDYVSI